MSKGFDAEEKIAFSVNLCREVFCKDDTPWVIGYSGGKDSSLVVKIIFMALVGLPERYKKPLYVFYCDTGVEIPVLRGHISKSLLAIEQEGLSMGLDIRVRAIKPKLDDRFFVKVIGRGYPPPSNKFRWCTDRLRIDPIQRALDEIDFEGKSIVVLGTRYSESLERDKILARNATNEDHFFSQSGHKNTRLFCPISNFDTDDVWVGLAADSCIRCMDITTISELYKLISGECPIIRMPDSNPCSKGRFGCWTCTVVRKDKATQNLVLNGFTSLQPLLDFRSWLLFIRDDIQYRCTVRRNGASGLGPFRLTARNEILERLKQAQGDSGFELVDIEELNAISRLWKADLQNSKYFEDYPAS